MWHREETLRESGARNIAGTRAQDASAIERVPRNLASKEPVWPSIQALQYKGS